MASFLHTAFTEQFLESKEIRQLKYPSLSKVLSETGDKSFLEAWRARVGEEEANRISREASARGNRVQDLIDDYLLNVTGPYKEGEYLAKDYMAFNQVLPFLKGIDETYAIELPLVSHKLKINGRLDWFGKIDGKPCVIDWKTTKKQKPREWIQDYYLQVMFYVLSIYEQTGIMCKKNYVVLTNELFYQKFEVVMDTNLVQELSQRRKKFKLLMEGRK